MSYELIFAVYIFIAYWFIVTILAKAGFLKRYNITAHGPVLLIRTVRGLGLLERLSRIKRFWRAYADIGTVMMVIAMCFMFSLLIYSAYGMFMVKPEPTELHEPRNWLLIPGLNRFIPMCAWIGFLVAMIVHEFSHGILSVVERIKVKSMGILVMVVPIGAFTEPDEEQLFGKKERELRDGDKKVASSRARNRVLSAGVTSNFAVSIVAFLLFFAILFSIQPASDDVLYVYGVVNNSSAARYGIEQHSFITAIDGEAATSVDVLNDKLMAGTPVSLTVVDGNGEKRVITVQGDRQGGVTVVMVEEARPAAEAGIRAGMTIIMMDNRSIRDYEDFRNFMNLTVPGEVVRVHTNSGVFDVKLAQSPYHEGRGYLGIGVANCVMGMVIAKFSASSYLEYLRGLPRMFLSPGGWLLLMVLPILPLSGGGFSTFNPVLSHFYVTSGVASLFGSSIFTIADILFWMGWINFYVGLFNSLPMYPLDGYHVFKELINSVLRMGIKDEAKKDVILKIIAISTAVIVFIAILFTLIAPFVFTL